MSDLEKIDAQFYEMFIDKFPKKIIEGNEIHEINEELFEGIGEINAPFSGMLYFLDMEDEKPVLIAWQWNRMADEERFVILDGDSSRSVNEEDEEFSQINNKLRSRLKAIPKKQQWD